MTIRLGTLVAELGEAGTGINQAVRGIVRTHTGEIEAYVKRLADAREILVEVVCASLARRLGLPVPEPMLVLVPEHLGGPRLAFGSAAIGQPNVAAFIAAGHLAAVVSKLKSWKQLVPAACFDEWITNCDRHEGNLLYNGDDDFWLIDHGLAIHQQLAMDVPSPMNHLFSIAVNGLSEGDLLMLRPKALGVMQGYSEHDTAAIKDGLPAGVWPDPVLESVFSSLATRQNHLVRLGSDRIPARQSEMFDGRHA